MNNDGLRFTHPPSNLLKPRSFASVLLTFFPQSTALPQAPPQDFFISPNVLPVHQSVTMRSILLTAAWLGSLLGPFTFAPASVSASPLLVERQPLYPCLDSAFNYKMPDDQSCKSYYICTRGTATKQNCPDGQTFNPWLGGCDDFEDFNCNF